MHIHDVKRVRWDRVAYAVLAGLAIVCAVATGLIEYRRAEAMRSIGHATHAVEAGSEVFE